VRLPLREHLWPPGGTADAADDRDGTLLSPRVATPPAWSDHRVGPAILVLYRDEHYALSRAQPSGLEADIARKGMPRLGSGSGYRAYLRAIRGSPRLANSRSSASSRRSCT
jgi:hypothetical protein